MHVVMRSHPNNTELADLLHSRKDEIEQMIRQVPGFVGWSLIRTDNGCMTATICQNKAGCDRSTEVARGWMQQNAPHVVSSMQVQEGEVLVRFTA